MIPKNNKKMTQNNSRRPKKTKKSKVLPTDRRTNGPTDGPTDRRTNGPTDGRTLDIGNIAKSALSAPTRGSNDDQTYPFEL